MCALRVQKLMNYWDRIRNYLQQKVTAEGFDNWLKGTAQVGQEGDTLYVSVPDRETRAWLETEYSNLIAAGIEELGLPLRRVSYETAVPRAAHPMAAAAPVPRAGVRAKRMHLPRR